MDSRVQKVALSVIPAIYMAVHRVRGMRETAGAEAAGELSQLHDMLERRRSGDT